MPRGRPPKHPKIRALEGFRGHRPCPEWTGTATGTPFIADHLSPDAKDCIEKIITSMPPGTYSAADSFALSAFAMAWSLHKRATEALEHEPPISRGRRGNAVQSPWIRILN